MKKTLILFLLIASIVSCRNSITGNDTDDVTDPAITATDTRYYIDNNVYIGSEICYDVKEQLSMPVGDTMSGLTKAKWAAAMYRYYSAVELCDGRYVCRVKNGAEINVAEKVYDMLKTNLADINNWLQKNEEGAYVDTLFSDEDLNMLLNLEFESDEHPE